MTQMENQTVLSALLTEPKRMEYHAAEIRLNLIKMIIDKGKGHSGGALSMVDILTALYFGILRVDPEDPTHPDRDRFLLSKGHACTALYATLAQRGYFPVSTLDTYYELDSYLGGHPVKGLPGIEVATGSLGHGPPIGLGMAVAARMGDRNHRIFVLVGDGEIQEGVVWESALFAAHNRLDNYTLVVDRNRIQSDEFTENLLSIEPIDEKFKAFGWACRSVDGHDLTALTEALNGVPFEHGKPSVLIANTVKGKGVDFAENDVLFHNKGPAPGTDEATRALEQLEAVRQRLEKEIGHVD
jgi:transketolase